MILVDVKEDRRLGLGLCPTSTVRSVPPDCCLSERIALRLAALWPQRLQVASWESPGRWSVRDDPREEMAFYKVRLGKVRVVRSYYWGEAF